MYTLITTKQFERDYKLCKKRGLKTELIHQVFEVLAETGSLPAKYKPHKLSGNYAGFLECHIQSDWLLVWAINEEKHEITLTRTGSHSDLF
ncbi:MAG: type II toxin-antitoxin system YafQ family toxin [Taibaiella sp.]|nr:type II toxin-antitoxin system YafQ family toxin [Taibaiella sp.]